MDAPSVAAAFSDGFAPDAILLALGGAGIWSRDFVCSRGTENVLAAVRSARAAAGASAPPPRLVCCSSMGVGDSAPLIPGFVRWLLTHPLRKLRLYQDWKVFGLNGADPAGHLNDN